MKSKLLGATRLQSINGVLAACIFIGIACRFTGLNWDSGFHLHPDERFLTLATQSLQWPHSWTQYFDTARAPLNPFLHNVAFFVYGQLPLLLVKAIADLGHRNSYDELVLIGRLLSAICDTLSVLILCAIGNIIGGRRLGLLSGALGALIALNIQHAHFFVTDTFAVTFLLAAFYAALCSLTKEANRWKYELLCGALWGAALACKFTSVLFGIVLVALLWAGRSHLKARFHASLHLLCAGFVAFRVLHPIAFCGEGGVLTLGGLLDVRLHPQFWNALAQQTAITQGTVNVPFNLQWFQRTAYLWPLENLGQWAVGWPLLLTMASGMIFAASRVLRRQHVPLPLAIAAVWVALVFLFYGGQFSKFTRYYLPALPFGALLAAWFLLEMRQCARSRFQKITVALGGGGVLLWALCRSCAVTSIYTRVHPRVQATQWIRGALPSRTSIANETVWDDTLPLGGTRNYRAFDLRLFEHDTPTKRRHLLQVLNQAQWIFISSPRVSQVIPRLPERYPLTAEYYRALFDGRLGFVLAKEFTSYPQLFHWQFADENVEEALTVYDHPHVWIFRKSPHYSSQQAANALPLSLCQEEAR